MEREQKLNRKIQMRYGWREARSIQGANSCSKFMRADGPVTSQPSTQHMICITTDHSNKGGWPARVLTEQNMYTPTTEIMIFTHQLFEFAYGDAMPSETDVTDEEVNWEWVKLKRIINR